MPIYALGTVEPDIDPTAYVHPEAVVIGNVWIGPEATIWPGAVLRGDQSIIRIGARTSIQDNSVLHTTPELATEVGEECIVGHLAHLEGCRVGRRCLIGVGSAVLAGAVVEDGSLVGAGAVVPGRMTVPSGATAVGVPAKLRPDTVRPEQFEEGVRAYVERGHRFRAELRRIG
jgi:carbonic anhydrase/acetyltransferase-like protein (isoleucine patch superfamily)